MAMRTAGVTENVDKVPRIRRRNYLTALHTKEFSSRIHRSQIPHSLKLIL